MRPWMQDPDGDGTYTWSSDQIPAGSYEFKIAHGLNWNESYGDGGSNVTLSVPSDGVVVTISYVLATHQISDQGVQARRSPRPDQGQGVLGGARPAGLARQLGAGSRPTATARLAAALVARGWPGRRRRGGHRRIGRRTCAYDAAGLPAAVTSAHPELKGYLALRLSDKAARKAGDILRGQVAVAMYDNGGALLDATGVQTAYVLDSLYAAKASTPHVRRHVRWRRAGLPALGPHRPAGQCPHLVADRGRGRTGVAGGSHADGAGSRRLVVGGRGGQERPLPLRGHGVRAHDRQDRDQPRHRPVLGCPDAELDPVGGGRPETTGPSSRRLWRDHASPAARAGRRLDDLRAARPGLLDRRRRPSRRRAPRHPTSRSPTNGDGHQAPARRSPRPGSTPCTCCRPSTSPRSRRTRRRRRRPACDLRLLRPGQRAAAGLRRRRSRPRTRSTGATTPGTALAPEGSYASTATAADGGARVARVPHHGRRAAPGRACGSCSTRSSTTRRPPARTRSRCSTRSCPATTSG